MAAPVLVLPEDLIVEILSWVPVKALMRFRCVSKAWNSLIFHPTLVKLHLQRSSKTTQILLTCKEDFRDGESAVALCSTRGLLENPSSIIDGCHRFDHKYYFSGSCNGLVCLYGSLNDELTECRFQIWNPATRIMCKDFPPLQVNLCNYEPGEISLNHGFGYDDQSDTYKVVVMLMNIKLLNWEMKVHCLGDTCWRSLSACAAIPIPGYIDGHDMFTMGQSNGRLVNGTLNWLAFHRIGMNLHREALTVGELVIFSYGLNKETYKYLSMPDGLTKIPDDLRIELGVLKGCLCLSHDHMGTHFVLWLMTEFGVEKSWTQFLNVSYEHLQIHNIPIYQLTVRPLCLSENGDVLLLANNWKFVVVLNYQIDKKVERTESFKNKLPRLPEFSYDYVETLVLPYRN